MNRWQKMSLVTLRLTTGWLMFYAGIVKVLDPEWSAAGYISNAKTFSGFYDLFLNPSILPIVNFLNEWGLTLLGLSLLLGVFVRLSSLCGAVLMLLYYFPALDFPRIAPHYFLVDEHIIFASVLLVMASMRPGRYFGLEKVCSNLPICRRFPKLRAWLG